jgi:anti-sigma B factor antagonist
MAPLASFALRQDAPEPGILVIAVDGEADMTTAVKFNESFFSAARSGVGTVIADLTRVEFIDSTMLNALVVGHRRMIRDQGRFAVVCSGPRLTRVLEISGLANLLDVYETRAAALAHIRDAG